MVMAHRSYSPFPSDDAVFRDAVRGAVQESDNPARIRQLLSTTYPHVEVVQQSRFGAVGAEPLKLYVYRDGRPLHRAPDGELRGTPRQGSPGCAPDSG